MAKKKTKKKSKSSVNIRIDDIGKVMSKAKCCAPKVNKCTPSGGCIYFLGFLGAAIYNVTTTVGFWVGVWGIIKALVWPAFLVFELMKYLGM